VRSHAEHELDRIVYDAFFRGVARGIFVDVGAAGPDYLSMSAMYRELGWRVIAVEPNPVFCEAHRAAGYDVLEYACTDHDEDGVEFEVVDSHGAVYEGVPLSFESGSALTVRDAYRALHPNELDVRYITVNARRLDSILAAHAPEVKRIDVVSVDVEGWELEVLAGFALERYRPRALIVENFFNDTGHARALSARGYKLWRHIGPNDVYVPESRLSRLTSWLARPKRATRDPRVAGDLN
jgi:FkbM family methyltransferase